ncbi:DoxX family membrane protein [Actinomadura fibrosa]|uniref:DoxX family membrane protein n=1 Tax=Actinomadura fibrosa TaxID=111802 RepID=A0ABW2XAR0_9ACTN|nr:DoxX family membrane protein [Actinomadura fibrosa]
MRPITTLARPFVAAPYIMSGLDSLRNPRERAERVGPTVKPIADRVDWLPKDPETLVRIQGAVSLGTGTLLLTGRFRRLTTLLLAAQLVPALATEHRYWTEDDPERRASERSHLLKNAGLFGALLMAASEPRRQPRLAELRRQVHDAQVKGGAEAKILRREAAATLKEARREAARQVAEARAQGGRKAAKQAAKAAAVTKAVKLGRNAKKSRRKGPSSKAAQAAQAVRSVPVGRAAQAVKSVPVGRAVKAGKAAGAGAASKASTAGKAVKGKAVAAAKR